MIFAVRAVTLVALRCSSRWLVRQEDEEEEKDGNHAFHRVPLTSWFDYFDIDDHHDNACRIR